MNHPILIENQKKRRDIPLWMFVCFSMFSFWQMAFIYYFLEPSSAMDGKIPLPINIDNGTTLTAVREKERGIIAAVITDAGMTEFHGEPTRTCLALEPLPAETADSLTGELPLY